MLAAIFVPMTLEIFAFLFAQFEPVSNFINGELHWSFYAASPRRPFEIASIPDLFGVESEQGAIYLSTSDPDGRLRRKRDTPGLDSSTFALCVDHVFFAFTTDGVHLSPHHFLTLA